MKVESLEALGSAFAKWRRAKRHVREPLPAELLVRARRAANTHGVKAVVRVTRVERARLFRGVLVPEEWCWCRKNGARLVFGSEG